jgi:hypothetical protein
VTARMAFVAPYKPVPPEAVFRALTRIGTLLDEADGGRPMEANPILMPGESWEETAYGWMVAAILIADRTEIDSLTLVGMAASVFKGAQDAFEF